MSQATSQITISRSDIEASPQILIDAISSGEAIYIKLEDGIYIDTNGQLVSNPLNLLESLN